jgi:hypothetical protein
MPYLLLKTLISLHCGNPSQNLSSKVSYIEVFKSIFRFCKRSQESGRNSVIALGGDGQYFGQRLMSVAA